VHILTGALGLLAYAAGEVRSRQFCIFVSAAYGLVTVLGFAGVDAVTDSMNINTADNWLHAFITGVALWGALSSSVPAAKIHRRRDFDDNDFRRAA
jgi:zinc transporter ZupT